MTEAAEQQAPKKHKWPRRALIAAAVLLFATIGLVEGLLPVWSRARLEGVLQERFGESATVGAIEWNPLAGQLIVVGLAIPNPPGFPDADFATCDRIELRLRLRSLLGHEPVVEEVLIVAPRLSLERTAEGRRNLVELFADRFGKSEPQEEEAGRQAGSVKPAGQGTISRKPEKLVRIRRVGILNASLRATDHRSTKYGGSAELAWDSFDIQDIQFSGDKLGGEELIRFQLERLALIGPEGAFRERQILGIDGLTAQFDPGGLTEDRIHFPAIRIRRPVIEQGVDARGKDHTGRLRRIVRAMFPNDDSEDDAEDQAGSERPVGEPESAMTSPLASENKGRERQEGAGWEIDELELTDGSWRESWWTPDGWGEHWVDQITLSLSGLGSTGSDRPFGLVFSGVANDSRGRIAVTASGRPLGPPGERTLEWDLRIEDMLITPLQVDHDIDEDVAPDPPRLENARVHATSHGVVANEAVEATIRLHFDELILRPPKGSIWERLASAGSSGDRSAWWSSTIERLRVPGEDRTVELRIEYRKEITGPRMAPAFQGLWTALIEEAGEQSTRLVRP